MGLSKITVDGNTATAYASYPFTEIATIYPITPSSTMAEIIDEWSAAGKKNLFGRTVDVREMQSEGGASGALHGALQGGALATTYTASQGLMLMLPNMYKVVGELLPGVFHVSARSLATNIISIFGDQQDVMSCRQTGVTMLASSSVQQAYHMALTAHLSAISSRVPVLHFFDGFRTSHEYQKIEVLDNEDLAEMLDWDAVKAFRRNALNPNHPVSRGVVTNPDIFFQYRESTNRFFDQVPATVEKYMDMINQRCGTNYHPFDYFGDPEAENVIVAMGSACGVIRETLEYWNARGKRLGLVEVHLFRPFSIEFLLKALPAGVRRIAVLDRTKEPGAIGEPLYMDVKNAVSTMAQPPMVIGGRFGLSSKDFTPADVMAVYANLESETPKDHFTVGIVDDVTNLSLPAYPVEFDSTPKENFSLKFWGLGSDGTVGANKAAVKIVGNNTDYYVQAYFAYDSKKSGGLTVSHLRMGPKLIEGSYQVKSADFIACHNQAYVQKYDMARDLKEGGSFLLNCNWSDEELNTKLPASMRRTLWARKARLYTIDAVDIAHDLGLGNRINMITQAAFFKISGIMDLDSAVRELKHSIEVTYGNKGQDVVDKNKAAVDLGLSKIRQVAIPDSWANAVDDAAEEDAPDYVKNVIRIMGRQEGDQLPVSTFLGREDGTYYTNISKWEKRGIAIDVPEWEMEKCIQCNQCSFVCPHAVIRPTLLSAEEAAAAPAGYEMKDATGFADTKYHLAISGMDCTGCGICVKTCPVDCLKMTPYEPRREKNTQDWAYTTEHVQLKEIEESKKFTVKGSQFLKPYLEFNGACAGCGETPYLKLITQLYGDHMLWANSAGCSHAWSGSPEVPLAVNHKNQGPAWGDSLFEDTAEYGFGMMLGASVVRNRLHDLAEEVLANLPDGELKDAMADWSANCEDPTGTRQRADRLSAALEAADRSGNAALEELYEKRDFLVRPSQWIVGGDGWAYDIDYGGLDHVLASGENVNVIVMDTEVYSNTGGQASKSTPTAAIVKFAASGKRTKKKDLGMMLMSYGYIYVAQVAMGADKAQTLKAIREAESYPGPSVVIAYSPCINHGIKAGMSEAQNQAKRAVECGYWHLYRFDPRKKAAGENPFTMDSKVPTASIRDFMLSEVRYASLYKKFPEQADELLAKAEKDAAERLESYLRMANRD